jgi:hypothetical protein
MQAITRARKVRGHRKIEERARVEARERANADVFWTVSGHLVETVLQRGLGARLNKPILLQLAREMSTEQDIPLDRMAVRYRSCTICWFCEIWKRTGILPNSPIQTILQQNDPQDDVDWVN